jgi:hypothetical protein
MAFGAEYPGSMESDEDCIEWDCQLLDGDVRTEYLLSTAVSSCHVNLLIGMNSSRSSDSKIAFELGEVTQLVMFPS